jgi:hypothetical protein|nr:MAG TPA: hypothetical protein [Caudoviricetes sp.]
MKHRREEIPADIEESYINSSFSRYKTIIQEQYALAKNNIDFSYSDTVSYKERQFLLEVLQEFLESTSN